MSIDLTKNTNLKHVRLGLGWQAGNGSNFDLDASALLLNAKGVVNDVKDVIFYNQLDTNRGVKSLGDNRTGSMNASDEDDETIIVELEKIPETTNEVLFIVTIDEAMKRNQNFGMVQNAYIRVINDDTNEELARYSLNEKFALQISCEIAKLVRSSHGWEFVALGNGRQDGLEQILISYGVR